MSGNLPLCGTRLWDSLMEMARIGATAKGGCNRQALSPEDGEGRALLKRWAHEIGLSLSFDRVGNMVLLREGLEPDRPPVAIGSHLDTQPTGGKFDGVLGVLAGLEVMRALHESGTRTLAPLVLVNWTNEEGARFSPPMMGSGVAMGLLDEATVLATRDAAGVSFRDALWSVGWTGGEDPAELQGLGAYLELHIEQGPELEKRGLEVGIVTHALAQEWLDVTVRGEDAHAGSAMAFRHDAMAAAARLVSVVEEVALTAGGDGRGTVGRLRVTPDSRNVVPSEVWFSVDLRHGDPERLARMVAAFRERAAEIGAQRGVSVAVEPHWSSPLVPFDPALVARLREAAQANGCRFQEMPTGIGHDAVYVARKVPTAMLFVPCHGGISHNEAESITPEWAEAGLRVLAGAVLATAGVEG
ncbi:Zn-dependent hydrolase [Roseomonas sp. OT10]|uniref:Zn-dependent hydrolase n=1 Tax=Roseomonas cutis TaxID=2897332 RepID=UPI001E5BB93F|nr:Zn-dependent hydrolase [Roseomonas sp. OT10]UFN50719.1 Zn-dependent hydrolase [Roseomonas sp. OT10]